MSFFAAGVAVSLLLLPQLGCKHELRPMNEILASPPAGVEEIKSCTVEPLSRLQVPPFTKGAHEGKCPGLSYQRPVVEISKKAFEKDFAETDFLKGRYRYVANIQGVDRKFYTAAIPKDTLATIDLQIRPFLGGLFAHTQLHLVFSKPVYLYSQTNQEEISQTFALILSGQGLGLTDQFNAVKEGLTDNLVLIGSIFTAEAKYELQVIKLGQKSIKQYSLNLTKWQREEVLNAYIRNSQEMSAVTTYSSINKNSNMLATQAVLEAIGTNRKYPPALRTSTGVEKFFKATKIVGQPLPYWHEDHRFDSNRGVTKVPFLD